MNPNNMPSERGFALIEVLVSLVIFSLGVVGLMGMQTRALQASTDAQDRSMAAMLANSVTSEMWAIKSTSLGNSAVEAWKEQVSGALPRGKGEITENISGTDATISVKWLSNTRKAKNTSDSTDGEDMNQFITKVVIPK
ncbi:prepilin-type N-terminal cleavage/methylation domain-containing protein [Comamonas sp. B-9]|uniref:type IV pilus modification PilV family protein n=1 Tax=Comamonas sp. B-9 TaxID=1055192 RepID=UPI0003958D9D|nr:prepilin-type N-terminal cleavage/methylation domain-containing protein [Comamonas sp. B-9]